VTFKPIRVGVEIECVIARDQAVELLSARYGVRVEGVRKLHHGFMDVYLTGGWAVHAEPTVRVDGTPNEHAVEIISPPLPPDSPLLVGLGEELAAAGAVITPTCALHVHVSGPLVHPAGLVAMCRASRVFEHLVNKERRRWAKPVPENVTMLGRPSLDELRREWFAAHPAYRIPEMGGGRRHPARRRMINLGSMWHRGTMEARWFNGSLSTADLQKAIRDAVFVFGEGPAPRYPPPTYSIPGPSIGRGHR